MLNLTNSDRDFLRAFGVTDADMPIPFDAEASAAMVERHRKAEVVLRKENEDLEIAIGRWIRHARREHRLVVCQWWMMGGLAVGLIVAVFARSM